MDLSIRFLILVLFGLVLGGSAQTSLTADDLLNRLEDSLQELVNQVQANDLNSCDLLSTCNAESTCSRLSCPLKDANTTGYACQGVFQNPNCKDNCPWRNVDFSRSFLRYAIDCTILQQCGCKSYDEGNSAMRETLQSALHSARCTLQFNLSVAVPCIQRDVPCAVPGIPRPSCKKILFILVPGVYTATDDITQRQLQGICAQRNLDSFFQKNSNNSNFFSLYFGSVDGTFRIFPGMDESDCGSYDPRRRLWYLKSTTDVKKAVMVLIDSGSSMTEIIPSTRSDSNFATACNTTESFLNTTSKDDYVNIFTFDQDKVEPFSAQPVQVTNTSSHPDFGSFTAMLSAPNESSVPPGNITDAISKVITTPAGLGNKEIPSDYLKVIILITDSKAVGAISNAALPWDLIKNNSISVFLYMFPPSTAAINASSLGSQLCAARGYFKILDDTMYQNPLLALEAYYSFLANIHSTYVNSGIDYSAEYSDFSDVDDRTFTLSKAVFGNNGELVGVAAIDIFKTKLLEVYGINGDAIEEAVRNRANRSTDFNASAGFNTITCLNQTSNSTCNQVAQASNIICPSNFNTDITEFRKLSCCGTCTGADKPRNLPLALGLGFGLGIAALATLAVIACFCLRNRRPKPDVFRGDDDEVK